MNWNRIFLVALVLLYSACGAQHKQTDKKTDRMDYEISKTEAEWKKILGTEAYRVIRQKGTEMPFSGQYNAFFKDGVYRCKACGQVLFDAKDKFDAHCGWPSFDKAVAAGRIVEKIDTSNGMVRTEILCGHCGAHLGHVFNDGPTETGLRYCVNSISLQFEKREEKAKK